MRHPLACFAASALVLVAGCSGDREARARAAADDLAGQRMAETIDPALTSALADQIMVDPGLTQQANSHSARMPPAPLELQIPAGAAPGDDPLQGALAAGLAPLSLGELATQARCSPVLDFSATWANRLPAAAPLYPDARVQAAAGDARSGCDLRVVSFSSGDPPEKLAGFYRAAAARAGFAVRALPGAIAGRRADGGMLRLAIALRRDGGSDVDLLVSGG